MLILGIDTATVQVSVAVGGHEGVLASTQSCRGRQHAETLTPVDRVHLPAGPHRAVGDLRRRRRPRPGLFTGLRVGVAAAKAMAHALRRADDRRAEPRPARLPGAVHARG